MKLFILLKEKMNDFLNFIEKYKYGIITALIAYMGIFMFLQLTSIPDYFEVSSFSSKDSIFSFILNDINLGEIFELKYNLNNDSHNISKIVDYPLELNLAHVNKLNDFSILGNVTNLDNEMDIIRVYEFLESSTNNKKVIPIKFQPKEMYSSSELMYSFNTLFTSHLRKINDNSFVCVLPKLKEIFIFDSELEIKHIINSPFSQNEIDIYMSNKNKTKIQNFVKFIDVTDNHIIVFYQEVNIDNNNIENAFLVFDHNLKTKAKLEISENLYSFEIDSENNLIYAIDYENENVNIYKTNFKL